MKSSHEAIVMAALLLAFLPLFPLVLLVFLFLLIPGASLQVFSDLQAIWRQHRLAWWISEVLGGALLALGGTYLAVLLFCEFCAIESWPRYLGIPEGYVGVLAIVSCSALIVGGGLLLASMRHMQQPTRHRHHHRHRHASAI
jgi:hypothetical protein